jgi:RNA polymerase sigma-70 factor (ECF subfamily)
MIPDKKLCERARAFDELALVEVYDCFSAEIFRYASRLLGDSSLAEECVAETFSRFLTALRVGGGPHTFLRAYLYRTAHNWISDYYRRQSFEALPLNIDCPSPTDTEPHHALVQSLEFQSVCNALSKLTSDQRQVIVLRYLEGWEFVDISSALNKPIGAVKALQHRALNSLKRLLMKDEVMAI